MRKFATQYDPRPRCHEHAGTREHVLYSAEVSNDGSIVLKPTGKANIYDEIQSHKDSCDINLMLKRFASGDVTALGVAQGAYGDFTSFPTNYAGLLNSVIAGEKYFNSLPLETRAKFDHSFEKFMVNMDNMPDFLSKLGVETAAPADPVLPDQKKEVFEDA